ncbi:MAG: prepilin-type N-terminal cleavage/methylation domain-containing protein [Muribaculaceae bacterium]|nr:prepilin-type N-terminal cleavage/methylation domain-containing protein [Muribaculaceae bacterium]
MMKFKDYIKKSAFTLAEILIALFIIAIIAMITLPVINRQLDKTDEYAYYMAFKTVEKMASQVVTIGEPITDDEDTTSFYYDGSTLRQYTWKDALAFRTKLFFRDLSSKIAFTEKALIRKFFPKAFAAEEIDEYTQDLYGTDSFISELWLGYRVCGTSDHTVPMKNILVEKENPDGTKEQVPDFLYYNRNHFGGCYGYQDFIEAGNKGSFIDEKGEEQEVPGPVAENDILMAMLPQIEAFKPAYVQGAGTDSPSLTDAAFNTLLNAIGYNNAEPNSGQSLCTSLGNMLKTNYTDSDSGTTVTYSTSWVPESSREGYSDDDDDDGEDNKTAVDSGKDMDDSFIDYGSKVSNDKRGFCELKSTTKYSYTQSSGTSSVSAQPPTFGDSDCQNGNNGYYNMRNVGKPNTIECVPASGYVYSENNPKHACNSTGTQNGKKRCYSWEVGTTKKEFRNVYCEGDFNESTKTCCEVGAFYNGSTCVCASGYSKKGGKCVADNCTEGYSKKTVDGNDICVLNPPIISAKRFCDLVAETWSIKRHGNFCDSTKYYTVEKLSGAKYYKNVFEAALGRSSSTNKRLMSIDSQPGAFAYNQKTLSGLKPNLILSNGLYMWILSDRVASIPGLTYTTDNAIPERNICKNLNKDTKAACTEADPKAYFCGAENGCYKISDESRKTMGDARNCCNAPDLSDIAAAKAAGTGASSSDSYYLDPRVYAISGFTVFVDINGSRGNGTLWEDVFPFYVSSNGMVYPGYPLDGNKSNTTSSNINLGGNSANMLPTDVYYYDVDSSGRRTKKVVFPNISYARALCSVRKISKNSPYCLNLGEKYYQKVKFKRNNEQDIVVELKGTEYLRNDSVTGSNLSDNPCDFEACYISVRRKLRTF